MPDDPKQRQADRVRDLTTSGSLDGQLARVFAQEQARAEQIRQIVNAGSRSSLFENVMGSAAIAATGLDPATAAALGAHGLYPYGERVVIRESPELQPKLRELEAQLTQLRADVSDKTRALSEQAEGSARKDDDIRELQQNIAELTEKQHLAHLLARVEPEAQRLLLESKDFRKQFDHEEPCDAFVMSIDIRRSTELMLKSRRPKLFAQFIVGLTQILREIVLSNHGIFDKFTGDGVLAFFPTFYSGLDAGLLVLQAAHQAHTAFSQHYDANRHCFLTVMRDVGLGVGVDYGSVQIVHVGSEFTVVGTPVVYACRMAGARAGETLVNQPAYEQLLATNSVVCDLVPVEMEIKHEGRALAYAARLNGRPYSLRAPSWLTSVESPPA